MLSLRKRKVEDESKEIRKPSSENNGTRHKRAKKNASTTSTVEDKPAASKKKAATKTSSTTKKAASKSSSKTEAKDEPKKATKKASVKATPATKKESVSKPAVAKRAARKPVSKTSAAVARAALIAARSKRITSHKPTFNQIPSLPKDLLNVYVFGSGTICELGLGPEVTEVKRPRLNPLLSIAEIGIVKLAVGGTHVLAIDKEGRLWSWGQNDSGVLGRATKENDDEVEDDWIINSKESTPKRVENIPESVVFVDVAATDNLSIALTDEGQLYAWGTFNDEGNKCFKKGVDIQREPVHVTAVSGIVQISGGKDHVLILDKSGDVYAWGVGTSNQLGITVNSQLRTFVFGPLKVPGVKNIKHISAGEFHSFAVDSEGEVYAWGLNNFGQCGLAEPLGDGAVVTEATKVSFFTENKLKIKQIACGNHHTFALTEAGDIYVFGEIYLNQLGIDSNNLPESLVRDAQSGVPAYVPVPTKLTEGSFDDEPSFPKNGFKFVASGTEHGLAISADDGSVWTWGSGSVYQLGHGKPAGEDGPEDLAVPTKINNTASRGVDFVFAGAGAQFSVLAGLPKEPVAAPTVVNGNGAAATAAKPKAEEPKVEETKA
ncbi:hypothetical protein D0Z00_003292 [Geotrichum galactomycetum]|uniref:Uncharacterized protein n=1 Tax=Geotrichum galactomycetum TaxID=27317 RepID=A0ACB6V1Q6_9ASCO|nr:hypothetical protein D0Z00_003292 [Geotrichum candidum]